MRGKRKLKDDEDEDCVFCDTTAEMKEEIGKLKPTEINKPQTPPDSAEIGRNTWALLHTIAAYYPDNPTEEKKQQTNNFLNDLSNVYPCHYCAKDFKKRLKKNPPKLDSSDTFSLWLCQEHNHVNRKLGKPNFDCSQVLKRWKIVQSQNV